VLPFGFVTTFRQQVHVSHQIAGIEVLRVDLWQERHVRVLAAQRRRDLPRALFLHVIEQTADKVGDQVCALSRGQGVKAVSVDRCDALDDALQTAFANVTEPTLVEVGVD